jgi:hypothetical protein
MVVVVAGNASGVAANVAASVDSKKAADAASTASSFFFSNNSVVGRLYLTLTRQHLKRPPAPRPCSHSSRSSCCLSPRLLSLESIIIAFVVVGVLSACRVSSALLAVASAAQAVVACRSLRLRWFCFRILSPALHPLNHAIHRLSISRFKHRMSRSSQPLWPLL